MFVASCVLRVLGFCAAGYAQPHATFCLLLDGRSICSTYPVIIGPVLALPGTPWPTHCPQVLLLCIQRSGAAYAPLPAELLEWLDFEFNVPYVQEHCSLVPTPPLPLASPPPRWGMAGLPCASPSRPPPRSTRSYPRRTAYTRHQW